MERTESNQEQRKNDKGNRLGLPSVPRQYDHSTCNFMNDTLGFLLATLHGTSTTAGIIDLESDASCSGNAGTIRTFHLVIPRVSLLLVTTLGLSAGTSGLTFPPLSLFPHSLLILPFPSRYALRAGLRPTRGIRNGRDRHESRERATPSTHITSPDPNPFRTLSPLRGRSETGGTEDGWVGIKGDVG